MTNKVYDSLIERIRSSGQPSAEDIECVEKSFTVMAATRNTVLDEQDKVPNQFYFIISGFMRLFYLDNKGEEQTTFLCSSNDFIASFSSLINQTKAAENVACITDCELLKISYVDAKQLVQQSEVFRNFFWSPLKNQYH